jgi:hypothetical protein
VRTGCARLQVAPAISNCTSSCSAGRSQGRRRRRAVAREPLTANWRGGYQRYIRTLNITVSPADLTACQKKFHFLHITVQRRSSGNRYPPALPSLAACPPPTRAAFGAIYRRVLARGAVNLSVFCRVLRVPNAESTSTTR